ADLPRAGQRGVGAPAHRLHQVPRGPAGRDRAPTRGRGDRRPNRGGAPDDPTMMKEADALPKHHYLNAGFGWRSWLLTTDHKRLALLYLSSVPLACSRGGPYAVLIRLTLLEPTGSLVSAETYNKLSTAHGVIMVFFFLIPAIPAVLGNFLIPLMVGAKDLA